MKTSNDTLQIDGIAIRVPDDCPDQEMFRKIVIVAIQGRFGAASTVRQCRDQWLAAQIVPEPFASNRHAADHYRSAMLALSPEAQAWVLFEEEVNRQFADCEDDGDRKEPAIPGWQPGWVSLAD